MWNFFKKLFGLDMETDEIDLDEVTDEDLMQTFADDCKTKCDGKTKKCGVDTGSADIDIDAKPETTAESQGECKAKKQSGVLHKPGTRKYHSSSHGGGTKNNKRQPRKKNGQFAKCSKNKE